MYTKYILAAVLVFNAAIAQKPLCTININNPLAVTLKEKVVDIPFNALSEKLGNTVRGNIIIKDQQNRELVYQWVKDGNENIQSLLVQADLPAGKNITITIQQGKPAVFKAKTFGRFVPERYDDFAWENDRLAFRMYGPALKSRPDNAYGIDVWSKRTTELVIDKWYKINDYHKDNGEGLDYYSVGFTLGAGDSAPFIDDSVYYSKNYASYKLLDNGPLRTCFVLTYNEWNAGNYKVRATKKISLDAGSQLNKIQVTYAITGADSMPVVVGIIKRAQPGMLHLDEKAGVLAYWEPQIGTSGITGVGCIMPGGGNIMMVTNQQLLAKSVVYNNKPFVYYTGAAWNKAGLITSPSRWNEYLYAFQDQLSRPVQVNVR